MLVSTSPRLAAWLQSASRLRICFSIAAGSTGGGTCATGCGGGDEHEMATAQTIKAIAKRPKTKVFLIVPPRCPRVVEQDANAANRSQAKIAADLSISRVTHSSHANNHANL